MKIAILDSNKMWHRTIAGVIRKDNHVDYFTSHDEFGKVKISTYDAILLDFNKSPKLNGEEVAKSIEGKTLAKVALMYDKKEVIPKTIVTNGRIQAIIDKNKPNQFVNFFKNVHRMQTSKEYVGDAIEQINNVKKAMVDK